MRFLTGNLWRRALTVFTQMNKKTQNGQKWGGSYPTIRPLEPSFMHFLTGNLWRRALTVFTQMNKKTRNGQKRRVNILTLFNTVGDKNLSVGKYDIKIYVGTKDKFPPPRQMWHKILCRNKRQICLGKYDNIIPFLFKHRLPCLITLHTDSIFQFFIPYRCTKVLR